MIKVVRGNIVKQQVDAVVNPINADLIFDKGIPSFIRRQGGEIIERQLMRYYPAKLGNVIVTEAGTLPAKHVLHLVNKEFGERNSYRSLKLSMIKLLETVLSLKLKSVAIPPIYNRFSPEITANILCDSISELIEINPAVKELDIWIVIFDREARDIFYQVFRERLDFLLDKNPQSREVPERGQEQHEKTAS